MALFLLSYDRLAAQVVEFAEVAQGQEQEAFDRRLALELQALRDGLDLEVVLLEATSEERLRRTNARYFDDLAVLLASAR